MLKFISSTQKKISAKSKKKKTCFKNNTSNKSKKYKNSRSLSTQDSQSIELISTSNSQSKTPKTKKRKERHKIFLFAKLKGVKRTMIKSEDKYIEFKFLYEYKEPFLNYLDELKCFHLGYHLNDIKYEIQKFFSNFKKVYQKHFEWMKIENINYNLRNRQIYFTNYVDPKDFFKKKKNIVKLYELLQEEFIEDLNSQFDKHILESQNKLAEEKAKNQW